MKEIAATAAKRVKVEVIIDEAEATSVPAPKLPDLIELSESFIAERLSVEIATDLVMDSMVRLQIILYINLYRKINFKLPLCIIERYLTGMGSGYYDYNFSKGISTHSNY